MDAVQQVVLLTYGYRDENARHQTWNPYDDPKFVAADAEILEAQFRQWNQEIIDRRVQELKLGIQDFEKSIASANAREIAIGKLSDEDKAVLNIRNENFDAQRERHRQDILKYEELISKLTSLSPTEIMTKGLVSYWWAFEPAKIQSIDEFVADVSDIDL